MIRRILAPNPGPMTLTGTNTWLLEGEAGETIVVDPGPAIASHRDTILATAGKIGLIVLTHRHHDHSELVTELAELTGARVCAADPRWSSAAVLADGEMLPGNWQVVTTPGHTDDSICVAHSGERVILTGDTVLGSGSSVIGYGEGSVAQSLASLEKLRDLAEREQIQQLLPGHGEPVTDPVARLVHDLHHRHARIEQVREAAALLAEGGTAVSADELCQVVYADVDPRLRAAAMSSLAAHMEFLGILDPHDRWLADGEQ